MNNLERMTGEQIKLALWAQGRTLRSIALQLDCSQTNVGKVIHGISRSKRVEAAITEILGYNPLGDGSPSKPV